MCMCLCIAMILCACASGDKESKKKNEEITPTAAEEQKPGPTQEPTIEPTSAPTPTEAPKNETKTFSFAARTEETERMIREAVEQYYAEDYTPLDEPVKYSVLWLGFTHVTYGELDFRMTDFDREYLQAVVLNYEKSVEAISNHNVDITVDFHFVDDVMPLTKDDRDDWLYLAQETVQPVIDRYLNDTIDTVLTTVQTAGEENRSRNASKEGYGVHDVILGLKTAGIEDELGYSTFNLMTPAAGTYPLADPEIPSLYATAVAVHEWMHQLEHLEKVLGVEYPDTHAYMGPESFPGYQKYIADLNDYDFFEFYKLVLQGKLPYTGNGEVKLVGMYPKMWPLIKRNVFNLGTYTVKAADGLGYLSGQQNDPSLTLSDEACAWKIRYSGKERFVLSPSELPNLRIDLGNAWDSEGNSVGLWHYTGYDDAQSWLISENDDGTCYLRTPYPSGRVITARKGQASLLCSVGEDGVQKWVIEEKQ